MFTFLENSTLWFNSIIVISLITTLAYWSYLVLPKKMILYTINIGNSSLLSLIFLLLGLRWFYSGYFPLSNLYESLLFLVWCILTSNILFERKLKSKILGALISPICTMLLGFATLILPSSLQKAQPLVPALQSNWLMLHVSMIMVSYALLIIGSLLSILYLILYKEQLNSSETNGFKKSNSASFIAPTNLLQVDNTYNLSEKLDKSVNKLEKRQKLLFNIDNWSYRIIGIGFPALTLGIITGAIWANEAWGSYWSWDPKETWALITWLIFASYLHARITKGWFGKKSSQIGSLGFLSIWLCYLGVNFLGKGLHSYGWMDL